LREKDHGLKHEKEKLNRANEMLRNYKDDNAWLVDALHIAAEHAANAGGMNTSGTSGTIPASSLRGMGDAGKSSSSSSGGSVPNSGTTSKKQRAKIKIGKDGVQRLVRE
jgi:hypothetical protein|tara:strand:- start:159 stop:485 length:327 start_codon:yes stop_codon:yes gene_type:complete